MGGFTIFFGFVSRLGDAELAATNVVIQSWSVAFMGAAALATGATALAGQCVGARRQDDARQAVHRVLKLGYVFMGMMAVVYVVFPQRLLALFAEGEDLESLLSTARPLFVIVVFCLVLDMVNEVLSGAMRGAGDTKMPMVVDLGSIYVLFIPALAVVTPRFGLIGAWCCLAMHLGVMTVLLSWRFRGEKWLKPPVEQDDELSLSGVVLDPVKG
jgi:MATE family multidrug resistance protein